MRSLGVRDGILYIGGGVVTLGDQIRNGAGAVDLATGTPTAWAPQVTLGAAKALLVGSDRVYLAGQFLAVGGVQQTGLAAVDRGAGATLPGFAANLTIGSDGVRALALKDDMLLAGGELATAGGQPRIGIAAVSPADGSLLPWNPKLNGAVHAIAADADGVWLGGLFTAAGGRAASRYAGYTRPGFGPVDPPGPGGPGGGGPGGGGGGAVDPGAVLTLGVRRASGVTSTTGGGRVAYPASIVLDGRLTTAAGAARAGVDVAVARQATVGSTAPVASTVRTGADGRFALPLGRLVRGTRVTVRFGTASAVATIAVTPRLRSTTRATQSSGRVAIRGTVSLPAVQRGSKGGRLRLQRFAGKRARTLRTITVPRSGRFSFAAAQQRGRTRYRVQFLPRRGNGLTATAITVNVRRR